MEVEVQVGDNRVQLQNGDNSHGAVGVVSGERGVKLGLVEPSDGG